ncbi:HAMP domain-containing sensor histidine kinase [Rhodococcus sp. NPDC049939]|uniref:sensor histidine kinase n=1 Tax=Rhodococcus sp. NPDC049939 TaxID=3155511 RepID=UPI0033C8103A
MPLRITLVGAVLLVTALGLLASGVAVTTALDNSLMRRIDQQLEDAAQGWAKSHEARPAPRRVPPDPDRPPSPFFVRSVLPNGMVVREINDESASPDLLANPGNSPVTVGSVDGSDVRWRALTTTAPDGAQTTIAIALTPTDQTVSQLIALQLGMGVVILIVAGVAAYFVVRRSLRPLVEVEEIAAAIASGDLHRRIPARDDRTEIGRLSAALNGMLAQIQQAFAATEASGKSAKRSEEKMRQFVADASHELRTPLTTIRGFAELYRQGAVTDAESLMSRIEGEASRMGLLVEDLLMLARLDTERPLESRPVDLLPMAVDTVHGARAVAPERSIELDVRPGPGTLEVSGDEARLRQVLGNLVANATKHTPTTADVVVRLCPTEESVILEVADTGPGLSEEDAARVFERFYRADASRTRKSGGSGLGLSIVAALVAAHKGTVSVETAPGEGATFRVELPRSR